MKNKFILCLFICCWLIAAPLIAGQEGFSPGEVKDISDRGYEKAVIQLLDNAQESIVISMYIIKPDVSAKHPINRLMKDLEEALDRGVDVTIFLNSKSAEPGQGKAFESLEVKGAKIYPITERYMLHDKMIIVDSRYAVVGSTNWSVAALNDNFESSVMIDSEQFAKQRLARMKTIHLEGEDLRGPPQISIKKVYPLPEMIELPEALMNKKQYFPRMISKQDNRAMDLYLLLKTESLKRKENEFQISLEKFARELNMPEYWKADALRRQVIKSLKKLKTKYGLIDVEFQHTHAARIKLIDIQGKTFNLKREFFSSDFLAKQRLDKKFIILIKAYLKAEGKDIDNFTNVELGKMFYVDRRTISEGLR
ncbi:MAG: phospholipase D-like domain-containing protein [Candidatus Omnitrophota bacterium]